MNEHDLGVFADTSKPIVQLEQNGFTPKSIPKSMDRADASELITDWFLHFFWDPAHETPYNSSEGGYQYVYGGPYELEKEIWTAFGDAASEEAIEIAINTLNSTYDVWEWAPSPLHPDQIEAAEEYRAFSSEHEWLEENDPFLIFMAANRQIEQAVKAISVSKIHEAFFLKMLFVQSFSVLESYLFDQLGKLLSENEKALSNFSKKDQFTASISFSAEQILAGKADVKKAVLGSLGGRVFHRFDKVINDYKSATDFQNPSEAFSSALGNMKDSLSKRHNCVHRNGKTIQGEEDLVSQKDVLGLLLSSNLIAHGIHEHCMRFVRDF